MENAFGKILLLIKEDGSELVAKLPYAGPSKYTTASEAAVLQYRTFLIVYYLRRNAHSHNSIRSY